jgi:hypothetical protein
MLAPMRRLVVGIALALLSLTGLASAGPFDDPIVGGTPATAGEFPTTVVIEVGDGLCTGTLVTKDWVLTAAHCVTASVVGLSTQQQVTDSIMVHFGTINLNQNAGMTVTAQDSIPDPDFGGVTDLGHNDSGLIHLSSSVTSVTPLKVNFDPTKAPIGVAVTMAGFGATQIGATGPVGIEYTVMQTSVSCASEGIGTDANLLCFDQSSGKGKCEGDSGGPSFATIGGKQVEVGITSFGDGSCSQYGADTRTDAEKPFLTAHVPGLECQTDQDCDMGQECFNQDCIITPFQPMGLGSVCTGNSDCESGTCGTGDGGSKCTTECTAGAMNACPSGFDCISAGAESVCWPNGSSGSGCCDASGAGAPTSLLGFALVGLVIRRKRRR